MFTIKPSVLIILTFSICSANRKLCEFAKSESTKLDFESYKCGKTILKGFYEVSTIKCADKNIIWCDKPHVIQIQDNLESEYWSKKEHKRSEEDKNLIDYQDKIIKFDHPNVAKLCGFEITRNYLIEIQEFVGTTTLFEYIKNKLFFQTISTIEKLTMFHKILMGVKYIHNQNFIHADLKPQNIVLDDKKNPKILNFNSFAVKNVKAYLRGTDIYLDPNILFINKDYKRYKFDESVDVYALGTILYFISQRGRNAFKTNSMKDLIESIKIGEYHLKENTSIEVAYLINMCIQFHKNYRWTMDQLIEYVEYLLDRKSKVIRVGKENKFYNDKHMIMPDNGFNERKVIAGVPKPKLIL